MDDKEGALKVPEYSESIHPNCCYSSRFFVCGIGWGRLESVLSHKCVARVAYHVYRIFETHLHCSGSSEGAAPEVRWTTQLQTLKSF